MDLTCLSLAASPWLTPDVTPCLSFTDEAFIMVPGPLRVIYIMALLVWKPNVGEGGLRVSSCVPVADFSLTAENHLGQTSGLSGL